MNKHLVILPLSLFLFTLTARAENCLDLKTCAKLMYDFDGQRYIWDAKVDEYKFVSSPNVEMTKETADLVFTAILDHVGLARVPVGDGKTYRVVKARQRREMEMPTLNASADVAPVFPNTWDWVTMRYTVKSAEVASYIEGAYRFEMEGDGALKSDENAGVIFVSGPVPMVRRMYEAVRGADRPLSTAIKERRKEKREKELELARHGMTAPFSPQAAMQGSVKTKN